MATATAPTTAFQQQIAQGTAAANPAQSDDPTADAPQNLTSEQVLAKNALDEQCRASLIELRRIFKARYQPKRMRFLSEGMRALEALRGNTYALLNEQSAALDTINQLMQGFLGQGDDPQLYAHNDNIYQAFCLIYIAALMVDLGKVRFQPAEAQDDQDLAIARKASLIQAFNERKNDSVSKMQLKLLYLWLFGSFFRYVHYTVDSRKAGTSMVPQIAVKPVKITPDGYMCPRCGTFNADEKAMTFTEEPHCQKCGAELSQANWYEGAMMDLPVQIGEIEQANGMTACDITNGLFVDANPDAMELAETEMLDYTVETSCGKVRTAYPAMYQQIQPNNGTGDSANGEAAKMARAGQTTPGSNNRPIVTDGVGSYSRTWFQVEAFSELQDETVAKELTKRFPKGCKVVFWGEDLILDLKPESLLDHWTWCGTIKGTGLYPAAVGKPCLDVQERLTGAVNKIDAYMDRVAYGTMLFDANYINGTALQNKVLTPGNMTGVQRIDEETGQRIPLKDLFTQMTFQIDSEIYKYPDTLTTRAQFLTGVMPQVFGGSQANVETARGQAQALNTALGRLKQYITQMRGEDAQWAYIGVKCSIDNMDEEIRIVTEGDTAGSWQQVRLLRAELTGDFFTYPETDEGFPATYEEVQQRFMTLLGDMEKSPFLGSFLQDPDMRAVLLHYILPPGTKLPGEAQRAKVRTIIHRLAQDKQGPISKPNPTNPQAPPIVIPSITPEVGVDDPTVCQAEAKSWLLDNWEQEGTNPMGYGNVLAYLRVSSQMAQEQQAEAAINVQNAKESQGGK